MHFQLLLAAVITLCSSLAINKPNGTDNVNLYPRFFESLERKIQAGMITYVDIAQFTEMIIVAKKKSRNRGSFLQNALYQGIYSCKGKCNVLVFNLAIDYKWKDQPSMKNTVFTTERYGNFNYGIWVFQDPATFTNLGEANEDNWVYFGRVKREGKVLLYQSMN